MTFDARETSIHRKVRLTFLGWLVVAGLLLLALLAALALSHQAPAWGMVAREPGGRSLRGGASVARAVSKHCVIEPVLVLEAGARKAVQKYYVTATAKDVAPGRQDAGGTERRYELGEYREHDQAIDACMDWVRCGTAK